MANPYELLARQAKTDKLVAFFARLGVSADIVREFDATDWLTVAQGAKVNPPSTATMLAVVAEMEEREKNGPISRPSEVV